MDEFDIIVCVIFVFLLCSRTRFPSAPWPYAENERLRAVLDLSGIPTQAQGDPDTTPPLRISVRRAREIMENLKCEK